MSSEIEKVQVNDVTCDQMMDEAAEELARIDVQAEHLLSVVTQEIRSRTTIQKGYILLGLRSKLKGVRSWNKFLSRKDVNLSREMATLMINVAQSHATHGDVIYGISLRVASIINSGLCSETANEIVEQISGGTSFDPESIGSIARETGEKIKVTQEKIDASRENQKARREEFDQIKQKDRNCRAVDDPEYTSSLNALSDANQSLKRHEERYKKLQAQLAAETKAKEQVSETLNHQEDQLAITTTKLNAVQEELDKMKFDDEISVGLMVKRTGYNLQNMVPQVLADVQRFQSTKGRFPEELRLHLETMIQQLTNYLNEHYA